MLLKRENNIGIQLKYVDKQYIVGPVLPEANKNPWAKLIWSLQSEKGLFMAGTKPLTTALGTKLTCYLQRQRH